MAKHFTHHQMLKGPTRRGRGTSYVQHHLTTADRRYIGNVTTGVLPDDVLVEIFSFYTCEAGKTRNYMEDVDTRVPKVAIRRVLGATSPRPVTCLYSQNTYMVHVPDLAGITDLRMCVWIWG